MASRQIGPHSKMFGFRRQLDHRQKIAKARSASKTPSSGLETANQKEMSQPESGAVRFVFTLFSQASEDRHFTEREISLRTLNEG
jgi:hypothetical protein